MPEQPELEAVAELVLRLLVDTFDFPEAEARQRLALWRAQQHSLEAQALEAALPLMTPEQRTQELLRWALEGDQVERELRDGAGRLGVDLTD